MKAAFKQALQEINSEQAAGQKKVQTGTVPVVMQVNNRELGRVVLKIMIAFIEIIYFHTFKAKM